MQMQVKEWDVPQGGSMNTFRPMLMPELVLLVLIATTWRPIARKEQGGVCSLRVLGFMFPALGLVVGIMLFLTLVPFGSMYELYERTRDTYWFKPVNTFFAFGILVTGILPCCGLMMSILSRRSRLMTRLAVFVWSCLSLCIFVVNIALYANSLH
jgi:hypothetical protein